jgi:hypothetical protein
MVPTAFMTLATLPLTPNGKVDRRALPAPSVDEEPAKTMTLSPTEAVVAEVWAQVLGLTRVGRQVSFFELGGHSLLATQVISRLRTALQLELPIQAIFDHPTVAQLARYADEKPTKEPTPAMTELKRLARPRKVRESAFISS